MPKNTYKKIITEIIKKELPEASIFLFGSRARGDNSPGSDVDIAIYHIATPYLMTDFYKLAKKNKWIVNKNLGNYNMCECVISYPNFTSQDIKKSLQWSISHFYLNFPYLFKQIRSINSLTDLKILIKYFFSYLFLVKNLYASDKNPFKFSQKIKIE